MVQKNQGILLAIIAILIVTLGIVLAVESYSYFLLQDRHASLQDEYLELDSTYQALNASHQELIRQIVQFYGNVTTKQAKLLIEGRLDLIVVDVRFSYEYDNGHLEDAINICVMCDPEKIVELDLNSEILVYCQAGSRSEMAFRLLNESGHYKVYNMLGGIAAWQEDGYPIET